MGGGLNNRVPVRLQCFGQDCTHMVVTGSVGPGDVQESRTVRGQMYGLCCFDVVGRSLGYKLLKLLSARIGCHAAIQ